MKEISFKEKEKLITNRSLEVIDALITFIKGLKEDLNSSEKPKKMFAFTCVKVIDDYFALGEKPQFHVDIEKINAEYLSKLDSYIKEKGIH